jgi:hypothetical protein
LIVELIEIENKRYLASLLNRWQCSAACSIPVGFRFRICRGTNCKQIIEIVLKLKDYCFFSFAELKKHVEPCCLVLCRSMQRRKNMWKKTRNRAGLGGGRGGRGVDSVSKHDESTNVIRKVMPCWAWVQTSFDASSAPGSCPQSHEILLNKGMKYWDVGLNAQGLRTFIATAHIAAAMIGWMHSVKERTRQTQLSTKFVFHAPLKPSVLFFPIF